MRLKIPLLILGLMLWQAGIISSSITFAQSESNSEHTIRKDTQTVSECTKNSIVGELPKGVNIPQQWCADYKKPADLREIVKVPGGNKKNKPNSTVNRTNLVYGGMKADIPFAKLPKEVRQLIELTFPTVTNDKKQLFSMTIVAEKFPSDGKNARYVRNYRYTTQEADININSKPLSLPNKMTWSFIKQGGKLKLTFLEVLKWDADRQTYN